MLVQHTAPTALVTRRTLSLAGVVLASLAVAAVVFATLNPIAELTAWLGISSYWAYKIFDTLTSWKAYLLGALMMSIGMGWATITAKALIKGWISTMGKKAARKFARRY
jgi:uncharacterized membrane protein YczE